MLPWYEQVLQHSADFSAQLLKESAAALLRWAPIRKPSATLLDTYDRLLLEKQGTISVAVSRFFRCCLSYLPLQRR